MSQVKKAKKRKVNVESEGIAYILASFNNVIVTITNKQGQVVAWSSSGREGFRGSKKNTPFAAQKTASHAATLAHEAGVRSADVFVKGPGNGREAAIRGIKMCIRDRAYTVILGNPRPKVLELCVATKYALELACLLYTSRCV